MPGSRPLLISGLTLAGTNLLMMALAIWLQWNLFEIIFLYWLQALFIGVFQRQKIKDRVAYARRVRKSHYYNRLVRDDIHTGFAVIYGLFWPLEAGILLAIYWNAPDLSISPAIILLASVAFYLNHQRSYQLNREHDERRRVTIENVLLVQLFRMLLPLHIFSVSVGLDGHFDATGIVMWMLIKTSLELGIHFFEHRNPDG